MRATKLRAALVLAVGRALVSALLLARLAGFGLSWLPGVAPLGLTLLAMQIVPSLRMRHLRDVRGMVRAHTFGVALALVVLLALVVRLPGYTSDLGNAPLDFDENRLAASVKHFFATGELLHDTVEHYPGSVFWLFSAASFASYVRGLAGGLDRAPVMLPVEFYAQAARTANILVGATIVLVTGLLGRRVAGPVVGILSAIVVAIVPLSVDTTILVRNDPAMVLSVTAAVHAALVFQASRRLSWGARAGALAGIATAIKYSSVFALVPVLLAATALIPPRSRVKGVVTVMAACTLAVAVTNHFVWADLPNFLRQLSDQVAITGRGHWAATDNPALFYVMILERFGPGLPLLALAGAFAVHALSARRLDAWIFLSFPLLYLWFMTQRPSQFPRWVYPMVPFVAVAGIAALMTALRIVRDLARSRAERAFRYALQAVAIVMAAAALWHPLRAGAVSFSRRVTPTTHTLTIAWMVEHIPPDSPVLIEQQWLDLNGLTLDVRRVPNLGSVLDGGVERLAQYDWVVVPEIYFGHPTLRRLGFMHRTHAEQGFGGSLGYDYEVYSVPKLPGTVRQD